MDPRNTEIRHLLFGFIAGFGLSLLLFIYDTDFSSLSCTCTSFNTSLVYKNNDLTNGFSKRIKILCWVMTNPQNHKTRCFGVKNTWGKRCDKLLFVSSKYDAEIPTVAFNLSEGREYNWGKIKAGFKYVYENHFDDADWFYKADDDAFVIFENLQYMLKDKDPNQPIWFGALLTSFVRTGWHSGGPGYVLSKEAVRRFVEDGIGNKSVCKKDDGGGKHKDDVEMGVCLGRLGVRAGDSRDEFGRHRFFPSAFENHIYPDRLNIKHWFWSWNPYPLKTGPDSISENAVAFHYVTHGQMFVVDYLIYHLKLFNKTIEQRTS